LPEFKSYTLSSGDRAVKRCTDEAEISITNYLKRIVADNSDATPVEINLPSPLKIKIHSWIRVDVFKTEQKEEYTANALLHKEKFSEDIRQWNNSVISSAREKIAEADRYSGNDIIAELVCMITAEDFLLQAFQADDNFFLLLNETRGEIGRILGRIRVHAPDELIFPEEEKPILNIAIEGNFYKRDPIHYLGITFMLTNNKSVLRHFNKDKQVSIELEANPGTTSVRYRIEWMKFLTSRDFRPLNKQYYRRFLREKIEESEKTVRITVLGVKTIYFDASVDSEIKLLFSNNPYKPTSDINAARYMIIQKEVCDKSEKKIYDAWYAQSSFELILQTTNGTLKQRWKTKRFKGVSSISLENAHFKARQKAFNHLISIIKESAHPAGYK
ncbi:MAG: hypothetical protein K8S56_01185, partial [Candidatus Cloacimonetes bacterium]|nr:hypothetical protein [Candidatus Cloacimonadota bacterium]